VTAAYQLTLEDHRRRLRRPRVVVSFAGLGGTCRGLSLAALNPGDAINHSRIALAIHRANHPTTRHHIEDVFRVRPMRGTSFFWLSPDCTDHSKAKNGKPKSGKSRALANVAPFWGVHSDVPVIGLENVEEFADWAPLDAEGVRLRRADRPKAPLPLRLVHLGNGERPTQAPRCMSLDRPLNTVVAEGVKQGVVVAFVAKHYGGNGTPGSSLDEPLGTVTCRDHNALVVARRDTSPERRAQTRAWLDRYIGPGRFPEIEDIGMRPLTPRELARAMGFPDSYILDPEVNGKPIGVTHQVRAIGNACCPDVVNALARSWVPKLVDEGERLAA